MPRTSLSLNVVLIALRSKGNKISLTFDILLPEIMFEYKTRKYVKVKNIPMGIFRILVQTSFLVYLIGFQLWYSRGYQAFWNHKSSVTNKIKGCSR